MTAFDNVQAIRAAKTIDLVAFWNEHNEKQITKFADRLTAEKRCETLMDKLVAESVEKKKLDAAQAASEAKGDAEKLAKQIELANTAHKKEHETLQAVKKVIHELEGEGVDLEEEAPIVPVAVGNPFGALIKAEQKPAEEAGAEGGAAGDESENVLIKARLGRSNSDGVRASWNDPEVREARQIRDGVNVVTDADEATSEDFKSTRAAFRALGLPDSKHIRFRMALKETGSATFEHAGHKYAFTIVHGAE